MSYLITKAHLQLQRGDSMNFRAILLENDINRILGNNGNKVTVFLSHKHDETDILKDVVSLHKSLGVDVYVDWMDSTMPKTTSGVTAAKLKEKIAACRKFIFLGTEGAIASKWCNWELGIGDAKKYPTNIAIMPIANNTGNYTGSEYLQIYPVIKTEYNTVKGHYFVEWGNTKMALSEWLKK